MVLPTGGAFSRDLLDQKSKSPLFAGDMGPCLQMISALVVRVILVMYMYFFFQASVYGKCVSVKAEVTRNVCSKEFEALIKCVKQAVRNT